MGGLKAKSINHLISKCHWNFSLGGAPILGRGAAKFILRKKAHGSVASYARLGKKLLVVNAASSLFFFSHMGRGPQGPSYVLVYSKRKMYVAVMLISPLLYHLWSVR